MVKLSEKRKLRTHKLTTTCVCIDANDQFAFSGSKDGSIIKWCIKTSRILAKIPGLGKNAVVKSPELEKSLHVKHVNCLAISSDNKYLASGGFDMIIRIWNPKDLKLVHTFSGHRGEVTGLVFRKNSLQLYSASADKSVKLWSLEEEDQMVYIESLFGHESAISSIDALKKERVLTSGGRDQSVRIWKIVEQAQTVYQSKHESVDVAKYIDDKTLVTGGEDGSLALWSTQKRNPEFVAEKAHKLSDGDEKLMRQTVKGFNFDDESTNFWISSLATHVRTESKSFDRPNKRQKLDYEDENMKLENNDNNDEDKDDKESDFSDDDVDKPCIDAKKSLGIFVASGSCNTVIKIWEVKITGSKHSINLVKSIPCHGFVNDLQFSKSGDKIVAAVGQEHKFGRWWKVRNAKNNIRVFDLKLWK